MDWNDNKEIAQALEKWHPNVNSYEISDWRLSLLVRFLPGFAFWKRLPDDGYLTFIRNSWISLQFTHYESDHDPHHM